MSRPGGVLGSGFLPDGYPSLVCCLVSSFGLPSGQSGPSLPSATRPVPPSLPSPCLLVVDAGVRAASPLGLPGGQAICRSQLFIYFSSPLCCPLRFQESPQTRQRECFLVFGNFSLFFKTPFLGGISNPTSFVSLFIFYIFSYLLLKTRGCFSRCLISCVSIEKLFCGICSAFKCFYFFFVF